MDLAHFRGEVWRMRWMILVPCAVVLARSLGWLGDSSALTLMLYKPAIACIGCVAAHIAWSQAFYYINCGDFLEQKRDELLGQMFIARAIFYAAFILGVCLGL